MKLEDLKEDILWEDDNIKLVGHIHEQTLQMALKGKAGHLIKDVDAIAKKGLAKAGIIGSFAYDQLKRYKTTKYKTIAFYARKVRERRAYESLIKTLTGTGQYKVIRTFPYAGGGRMWELKRVK